MDNSLLYNLSPQQKELFRASNGISIPVTQLMLKLDKLVARESAHSALCELTQKHLALRTSYLKTEDNIFPFQQVRLIADCPVKFSFEAGNKEIAGNKLKIARVSIKLDTPFSVDIITGINETWIIFSVLGYSADLHSLGILGQEFVASLTDQINETAEDVINYLEFSEWQDELLKTPTEEDFEFWNMYPIGLNQQFKFYNRGLKYIKKIDTLCYEVPEDILNNGEFKKFNDKEVFFLAIWMTVLARHNSGLPVTIGYMVNGRQIQEIEELIGYVNKTLPLTVQFNEEVDFYANLQLVADEIEKLKLHQYSYGIKSAVNIKSRDFSFETQGGYVKNTVVSRGNVNFECLVLQQLPFSIQFICIENPKDIKFQFTFNTEEYSGMAITELFNQMITAIESIVSKKTTSWKNICLGNLTNSEIGRGNIRELVHPTVNQLFRHVASLNDGKTAVTFNEKEVSYGDLQRNTERVAMMLIQKFNVEPGDRIGVFMERSHLLITAFLGILQAGATFVPIDPYDATSRINHIITDCNCNLVISNGISLPDQIGVTVVEVDELLELSDPAVLLPDVSPQDNAYIIYTSGTSGRLKGVMVRHESLVNYVTWIKFYFNISADDSAPFISSHAFDLGYTALWGTLLSGGTIHIIPEYLIQIPEVFVSHLQSLNISFIKTTPSFLHLMLNEAREQMLKLISNIRMLIIGGEKYRLEDLELIWTEYPEATIINHYGPTETTIGVIAHKFNHARMEEYEHECIIGLPCDNNHICVLDDNLHCCPPGIQGQIYIQGKSVTNGYYNKERYNSKVIIYVPEIGSSFYKTGDEGYWNLAGEMVFAGRKDNQIKINGYRVEISEVETAIKSFPLINDVVVTGFEKKGDKILACYYVSTDVVDINNLREKLKDRLPTYMIPAIFKQLSSIPLTVNNKIDFQRLPDILTETVSSEYQSSPKTEMENILILIWKEVLGLNISSIYDNFFQLGGDSIKAIQISSRLYSKGYQVQVKDIFQNPQVYHLAKLIKPLKFSHKSTDFTGSFQLPPIYKYFFEHIRTAPHHYNQSLIINIGDANLNDVDDAFGVIFDIYDILRLKFVRHQDSDFQPVIQPKGVRIQAKYIDLRNSDDPSTEITKLSNVSQTNFNLLEFPLINLTLFSTVAGNRLLIILHHLVTDLVSWNILLDDLDNLLVLRQLGKPLLLPPASCSFGQWSELQTKIAFDRRITDQLPYWLNIPELTIFPGIENHLPGRMRNVKTTVIEFSGEDNINLQKKISDKAIPGIQEILVTSICRSLYKTFGMNEIMLMMESHGREDFYSDLNLQRCIGWFTVLYPLYVPKISNSLTNLLMEVSDLINKVPDKGIGYGILRYLTYQQEKKLRHEPWIRLNCLGNSGQKSSYKCIIQSDLSCGTPEDPDEIRPFHIDITAVADFETCNIYVSYSSELFTDEVIVKFCQSCKNDLKEMARTDFNSQNALTSSTTLFPGVISELDAANFFN